MKIKIDIKIDDRILHLLEDYGYKDVYDTLSYVGAFSDSTIEELLQFFHNNEPAERFFGVIGKLFVDRLEVMQEIQTIGWTNVKDTLEELGDINWGEMEKLVNLFR